MQLGYCGLHLLGVDVAPREAMLAMTPLAIGILALIVLRIKKVKGH
ncbi:hypothetical protein J2W17_002486 [Pseudomonas lini]|nr:hypothetical protein [Pseudomonas lini]MDQ0123539.1 hypothetical protein [Pseudomonas lini]